MTNEDDISIDIRVNVEKLDAVDSSKYLGAVVIDQGSKPELLSRISQETDKPSETTRKFSLAQRSDFLSRYSCSVLRNLDNDSGHPEEIAGH